MANIAEVAATQKTLEVTLLGKMAAFEDKLKAVTPQSADVAQLSSEFHEFKSSLIIIFQLLRLQIADLSQSIDRIETRHRQKFLLLGGVPESNDLNLDAVVATLLNKHLGMSEIGTTDIISCHRLGTMSEGRCRPIVFQLANPTLRLSIWNNKTKLKGTSFVISEFLTRRRQSLFLEARRRLGMKNVWTLHGQIYAKDVSGVRHRISTTDELDGIIPEIDATAPSINQETTGGGPARATVAAGRSRRGDRTKQKL
ncbi:uncharacterized protein ACR2FA_003130 [Aphomia sociella]